MIAELEAAVAELIDDSVAALASECSVTPSYGHGRRSAWPRPPAPSPTPLGPPGRPDRGGLCHWTGARRRAAGLRSLADPRLDGWLAEQAGRFAELTERQRDQRLRKVEGQIAEAGKELLAARKQEALAAVEREFAGEAA